MKDNLMTYLGFAIVFVMVTTRGETLGKAIRNFAGGVTKVVGEVIS